MTHSTSPEKPERREAQVSTSNSPDSLRPTSPALRPGSFRIHLNQPIYPKPQHKSRSSLTARTAAGKIFFRSFLFTFTDAYGLPYEIHTKPPTHDTFQQ